MYPVAIQSLPDEILLSIFRYLPAYEFIVIVPVVCKQWLNIIKSDSHTLKRIGMYYYCSTVLYFFYLKSNNEDQIFHSAHKIPNSITENCIRTISFGFVHNLITQYRKVLRQVKTLVIEAEIRISSTIMFNNLTTLVFNNVKISHSNKYTLKYLGIVCPNIQNVIYLNIKFPPEFDTKLLYTEFKQLKRFYLDHFSVSHRLLDDLLKTHCALEDIMFMNCNGLNDIWIDVLMEHLKGRTVKLLSMNSPYFTKKRLNEFLMSDLFLNESKIFIDSSYIDSSYIDFALTLSKLEL